MTPREALLEAGVVAQLEELVCGLAA